MQTVRHSWLPEDWQAHCNLMLRTRYGADYQEVPSKDQGDLGIEGFARDGCVFQCYVAESGLAVRERYERQRNKLSRDVWKLVENDPELCSILGEVRIARWVFLVPAFESKELISHANAKAREVRDANPSCIADDFAVAIGAEDYFSAEAAAFGAPPYRLGIVLQDITQADLDRWASEQTSLVKNLESKAAKIPHLKTAEARLTFVRSMIGYYIDGQNVEARLRATYTDIWLQLTVLKAAKARFLGAQNLLASQAPHERVTSTADALASEFRGSVPLFTEQVDTLAWGTVAAWIAECAMDFHVDGLA